MNDDDLFAAPGIEGGPLAARLRARQLDDYVGQHHLLAPGRPFRENLDKGRIHSMIFWGPPGVGKTTLARLLASAVDARFIALSAVLAGVKELRLAVDQAREAQRLSGRRTILFIDEVHRFNKAQQDAFLPHVEEGTVVFVGATTENPSFEVNRALLSRCRVYVLKPLEDDALSTLIFKALKDDERGLGARRLGIADDALTLLVSASGGDARRALNVLEIAAELVEDGVELQTTDLAAVLGERVAAFDKGGELFYEQISALHKSVRGSDPDASLYWLLRMLEGGCDPLYIARRLVRMASEDVGNADPRALDLALAAWHTQERLGSPEGELTLAQAVLYLAAAPKSNAVYNAYKLARADVRDNPEHEVPVHLRNAPTKLLKELGYGRAYRYAHDEPDAFAAGEIYFPDAMTPGRYYEPVPRGLEIKIKEKLDYLRDLNRRAQENAP